MLSSPSILQMLLCSSLSTLTLDRFSMHSILYIRLLPRCRLAILGTFSKLVIWVIYFSSREIIVTFEKLIFSPGLVFIEVPFNSSAYDSYFFGYSFIECDDLISFSEEFALFCFCYSSFNVSDYFKASSSLIWSCYFAFWITYCMVYSENISGNWFSLQFELAATRIAIHSWQSKPRSISSSPFMKVKVSH